MEQVIAEINRKLATLGYTAAEIEAVQPVIRTTLASSDVDYTNAEDSRQAAEDVVLLLIDEMDNPAPPGGVTPHTPPPISAGRIPAGTTVNVFGNIDDLLAGAPPLRGGTPGIAGGGTTTTPTRNTGNPGLTGAVNLDPSGKFRGPGFGRTDNPTINNRGGIGPGTRQEWQDRTIDDIVWADQEQIDNARLNDPLDPYRTAAWNWAADTLGFDPPVNGTRSGGIMDTMPVGSEPGSVGDITVTDVLQTFRTLAPYARRIWEQRNIIPQNAEVLAQGLQYIMAGNPRVQPVNNCNYVAKSFAQAVPDVAKAIAQFQCGLSEPIMATERGKMVFLALKLHHAGIDFNSMCDCG